jgi:diadenosine tetraphosphate (Ap4A) HIT family hydrolase
MFYDVFKPEKNLIKEFNFWVIVAREKHLTLGSSVIILKREVQSLANINNKEILELPKVINWYENKCKSLYDAEKFNYMAMMMKDNFVHFHAFPRYSKNIEKFGITFKDEFWPRPLNLVGESINEDILKLIIKDMKD